MSPSAVFYEKYGQTLAGFPTQKPAGTLTFTEFERDTHMFTELMREVISIALEPHSSERDLKHFGLIFDVWAKQLQTGATRNEAAGGKMDTVKQRAARIFRHVAEDRDANPELIDAIANLLKPKKRGPQRARATTKRRQQRYKNNPQNL
jgi:hypothetical protein